MCSPPLWTDAISACLKVNRDQLREKFWLDQVICLGGAFGSMPVHRAGDQVPNPCLGKIFS